MVARRPVSGAAAVEPGADGVGASRGCPARRAPHWRAEATAAFIGLRTHHSPAELAHATVEGIAYDVARCAWTSSTRTAPSSSSPAAAPRTPRGRPSWAVTARTVVVAATSKPRRRRRATASRALGGTTTLDTVNPVVSRTPPIPAGTDAYVRARADADRRVDALLGDVTEPEEAP